MKTKLLLVFFFTGLFLSILPRGYAGVPETLQTVSGKTYTAVKLKRAEPDGLLIMHSGGVSKILFPDLAKEIQIEYGYDPDKALEFQAQLAEKQKAHDAELVKRKAEDTNGQSNPEITKIDARLVELKAIWLQDNAEIDRWTNFKRSPVQEGSQAYYAVREAAERMQQAEAEISTLNEKRHSLLSEAGASAQYGSDSSGMAKVGAGSNTAKTGTDNPVLAKVLNYKEQSFDVEAAKERAAPNKNLTPVFKGFYLGMPAADALGLVNSYMELSQPEPTPITINDEIWALLYKLDITHTVESLRKEVPELDNPYRIVLAPDEPSAVCRIHNLKEPFAILDEQQNVIEFRVTKSICDKFFDTKGMPLVEFIRMFSEAYKIDLPLMISPDSTDGWVSYTHRDERGFEITFWAEGDEQLTEEAKSDDRAGGFWLKRIGSGKEREAKFD